MKKNQISMKDKGRLQDIILQNEAILKSQIIEDARLREHTDRLKGLLIKLTAKPVYSTDREHGLQAIARDSRQAAETVLFHHNQDRQS